MANFKPEVQVGGEWGQNALVFKTEEEALASAKELYGRWLSCTDYRAVETNDAVNEPYTYKEEKQK